jgi:DNA-binding response OmpR family regulator
MPKACNIALVDDDSNLTHLLSGYLAGRGMKVAAFARAEDLLSANPGSFDAVILDICLPGMWGSECVYRLRNTGYKGPVIAITGYMDQWDEEDLSDLGFDRVLPKPFDPCVIADCIGECLGPRS